MSEEKLMSYAHAQPNPTHFEMMPGFIDYLTYIEQDSKIIKGIKKLIFDESGNPIYVRKRLKPIYKDIYRVITKLAGEAVCMRTESYIAQIVGCSTHTVADAKEVFQNSFEQIDGLSLITVDEQRCLTTKIDENGKKIKVNKRPVHICHLTSIWRFNNPFMKIIYAMDTSDERRLPPNMVEKISIKEAEFAIEKMSQPGIQDFVRNEEAERKNAFSPKAERKNAFSPPGKEEGRTHICARHNTPSSKPFVLKQDPAEKAIHMSLINQKNVQECFRSEHKATEFLEVLGFKESLIRDLLTRHNLYDMTASILYLQKHQEKIRESVSGYFLSILENKWFMPKPS